MNKKGFTLVELLITILIVMILAGYAIFAYLDSVYEAEATQAKAKLELISAAYERFNLEYPSTTLTQNIPFTNAMNITACSRANTDPSRLIGCGYLSKMDFDKEKFQYFLGPGCGGDGFAYMKPKQGESLGKFGADKNYCAGISLLKGGRAIDGAS